MGVNTLWKWFSSNGMLEDYKGDEANAKVVSSLQDAVLAVDLSGWILQASKQHTLMEMYSLQLLQCLPVLFGRVTRLLQYGAIPLAVTEGIAPVEKHRLMELRAGRSGQMHEGGHSSRFASLGDSLASILNAMGLPTIRAPGEAEAVCAALNQAGYVDGCVTLDGDALLFGAELVYQTLKLEPDRVRQTELRRISMEAVRRQLGITKGGSGALRAMALLTGNDYHLKGARGIGVSHAWEAVSALVAGCQSDEGVVEKLVDLLEAGTPDSEDLPTKCTGCKRCGHEGNRTGSVAHHHSHNPCTACPAVTSTPEDSQDAPGSMPTCVPRHANQACQCAYHRSAPQRMLGKVAKAANSTVDFQAMATTAVRVYCSQTQQASEAVKQASSSLGNCPARRVCWRSRPDPVKVHEFICKAAEGSETWSLQTVRRRLLPLLMLWDASHPSPEAELKPTRIVKVRGGNGSLKTGEEGTGAPWQYIMEWERSDIGEPWEVEQDKEVLQDRGKRALSMSLVQRHWPKLVEAFEERETAARAKKTIKAKPSKADRDKAALKGVPTLDRFMRARKVATIDHEKSSRPSHPTAAPSNGAVTNTRLALAAGRPAGPGTQSSAGSAVLGRPPLLHPDTAQGGISAQAHLGNAATNATWRDSISQTPRQGRSFEDPPTAPAALPHGGRGPRRLFREQATLGEAMRAEAEFRDLATGPGGGPVPAAEREGPQPSGNENRARRGALQEDVERVPRGADSVSAPWPGPAIPRTPGKRHTAAHGSVETRQVALQDGAGRLDAGSATLMTYAATGISPGKRMRGIAMSCIGKDSVDEAEQFLEDWLSGSNMNWTRAGAASAVEESPSKRARRPDMVSLGSPDVNGGSLKGPSLADGPGEHRSVQSLSAVEQQVEVILLQETPPQRAGRVSHTRTEAERSPWDTQSIHGRLSMAEPALSGCREAVEVPRADRLDPWDVPWAAEFGRGRRETVDGSRAVKGSDRDVKGKDARVRRGRSQPKGTPAIDSGLFGFTRACRGSSNPAGGACSAQQPGMGTSSPQQPRVGTSSSQQPGMGTSSSQQPGGGTPPVLAVIDLVTPSPKSRERAAAHIVDITLST
eukprot:jgi/Botrbrau1/13656/Bobra.0292s0006.1